MRIASLLLLLLASTPLAAAPFRAAAVKIEITPTSPQWLLGYQARQSDGVHDPLFHRIAALEANGETVYFVASDVCLFSPEYYDRVAARVEKELGIAPKHFWWFSTHTHSAPEVGPPGLARAFLPERYKQADAAGESNPEYSRLFETRLLEGLRQAKAQLAPARLGVATGAAMANINRRAIDIDGKARLGMNPEGPVDRQLGLLRLEKTDGSLIGLIVNYAIHGTALSGQNLKISGDVQGVTSQYVEEKLNAPVLFINGAEGNLAPIYSVYPTFGAAHIGEFRVLIGDRILALNKTIGATTTEVGLKAGEQFIESPLKEGLNWPEELNRYLRRPPAGAPLVRVPVRYLRLNQDTVLWGAPLEMFCEIALDVRGRSPFPHTYYLGLTNGWLGYLTTAAAFGQAGYEPSVSPFTTAGEAAMREGVSALVEGLAVGK